MIKLTVVFGTVNLLAVFQEVLHAVVIFEIIAQAQAMERMIVSAHKVAIPARHTAGKMQLKYLVSTMSNLLQRILNKDRNIRNATQRTRQYGRRYFLLA